MRTKRFVSLFISPLLLVGCPSGTYVDDDATSIDDDDIQDDDLGDDDLAGDDDTAGDDDSAGDDDVDNHLSTSLDWLQVAAGSAHACGLHQNGLVECWGLNSLGLTSPPPLIFSSISSNCGILPTAEIQCWGDEASSPLGGAFIQVDSEPGYCAIDEERWIHCWGDDEEMGEPPEGEFVQIDDGCGTAVDGTIHCWRGPGEVLDTPDGVFTHVAGGGRWACGVRLDGTGVCWGDIHGVDGEPLSGGPFDQVDVAATSVCWLRGDAIVECRGGDDGGAGNMDSPDGASFTRISMGDHFGCGVRSDGRIQCWGNKLGNEYGQMSPP